MSTAQRKRILLVSQCFSPNIGGVETHLDDIVSELNHRQLPTTVLTYKPLVTPVNAPFKETRSHCRIYRIPWIGFGLFNRFEKYPAIQFLYLFPPLFIATFCYLLFQKRHVQTIHFHGMVCAVMARILGPLFRIRTVLSTHTVYGWIYSIDKPTFLTRFLSWALKGIDHILALADLSVQEMVQLGADPGKVSRYTYWVDLEMFSPGSQREARSTLGLPDGFTLLFVGRLVPPKGIDILLRAVKQCPEVNFVIAGDGPLSDDVRNCASSNTNLHYVGPVAHDEVITYYRATDMLCAPSYGEGFPRTVVEAISSGCPILSTPRGCIPEAVPHSVGVLTEPNESDLVDAVKSLAGDPAQVESLQRNCRPYAEKHFSRNNMDALIGAYELDAI